MPAEPLRTLGPQDLVLCAGTLAQVGLKERAAAAVEGGFTGLSFFCSDYELAREQGMSDADIRSLLSDHGLGVGELDPLLTWVPGTELASGATAEGVDFFGYGEDDFYRIHDALGARSINAVVFTDKDVTTAELGDAFGALCERADRHDLLVHLEFMPWTQVPNAATAWQVVSAAGAPANGGIMLDTWHHFRGGCSAEDLRVIPVERILAVQLNDATAEPRGHIIHETLHGRLVPGDGAIDLVEILTVLHEGNAPAPLGVEVFLDELMELPAADVARRCGDATRRLIGAARGRA
jgi:sugar phosphate isomerase/epimerase